MPTGTHPRPTTGDEKAHARRTVRRVGVVTTGLVTVLLTGACAAQDAGSTTGAGDGAGTLTLADSPLAEYMGDLWTIDTASIVAEQREIEELTAQCMADAGFEYTPADVEEQLGPLASLDLAEVGTREWISQHGYDLATAVSTTEEDTTEVVDPNLAYVETLSAASRAEYDLALYGDLLPPEDLAPEEAVSWEPQHPGCASSARDEVSGPAIYADTRYQELMSETLELEAAALEDPDVVAANDAWADCMADAGHPGLASPAEARDSVSAALDELWATAEGDSPTSADLDTSALAELREHEIGTALADDTCQVDSGYRDALLRSVFAAEEQFLTDHQSELDALKEEYGR